MFNTTLENKNLSVKFAYYSIELPAVDNYPATTKEITKCSVIFDGKQTFGFATKNPKDIFEKSTGRKLA
jgi:hypothetical protein